MPERLTGSDTADPRCLVDLFEGDWDGVRIPIVQRDYAQGRPGAAEVRERFLEALHQAIDRAGPDTEPLDLDFVYGYQAGEGSAFVPIDGQQRLTTLFLLHWYLAHRDGERDHFLGWASRSLPGEPETEDSRPLRNGRFQYEVRTSSDDFLRGLIHAEVDFALIPPAGRGGEKALSQTLCNEHWYFRTWKRDPTVRSCLTMLDAIHAVFGDSEGFYRRLVPPQPAITFRFLDLKAFGLGDELYIKMNARGRALTYFEVFKSEVEKFARSEAPLKDEKYGERNLPLSAYLDVQFDTTWLGLFWSVLREEHRDDASDAWTRLLDRQMLNLLRVLAIVCYPGVEETGDKAVVVEKALEDLHNGLVTSFHGYKKLGAVHDGWVRSLMTLLDLWAGGPEHDGLQTYLQPTGYFDESYAFAQARTDLPYDRAKKRKPAGSVTYTELVCFAAYCEYLLSGHNRAHSNDWMRVLVNLAENSLVDGGDDLRRALRGLRRLMADCSGEVLTHLASGGNVDGFLQQQVREERLKAQLILHHDDWRPLIERAELHRYFRGQIEFLLDFSGLLEAWLPSQTIPWDNQRDSAFREAFELTLRRAEAVFANPSGGLTEFSDFRFERALLCLGDYTLRPTRQSAKRSLGVNPPESPASWKVLLRADTRNESLQDKRAHLRDLFAMLDPATPMASLDAIIGEGVRDPEQDTARWREPLIKHPEMLAFCRRRWLLWQWVLDDEDDEWKYHVLLMGQQRRGPWHCVKTWEHGLALQQAHELGKLAPFTKVRIEQGSGGSIEPRLELWLPRKRSPTYEVCHAPGWFDVFRLGGGKEEWVDGCADHELVKMVRKLAKKHR